MTWYRKEDPTTFDKSEIPGLFFLDGDILAEVYKASSVKGQKSPTVEFPSGKNFDIWEGIQSPIIHIFGEMDLRLYSTRDEAFEHADYIAQACGYLAHKEGNNQLIVIGSDKDEYYRLTYDNEQKQLINIEPMQDPKPEVIYPGHVLITDEIKAKLPPLYSTGKQRDQAIAQVKYFLPSSGWTWYATEFDGEQILFGLVVGVDTELGYFTLDELEDAKGLFGLPVERDLYFKPTSLAEIRKLHR
jgi:hypothetical protein